MKKKQHLSQFNNQLKLSKQSWKTHAQFKGRKYFFYQEKVIDLHPYLIDFPQDTQLFYGMQESQKNLQSQNINHIQLIIDRLLNYQIGIIDTGISTQQTIHSGWQSKAGAKSCKSKKSTFLKKLDKINQSASSSAFFDAIIAFHYQAINQFQLNQDQYQVPTTNSLNFTDKVNLANCQHNPLGKNKRNRSFTHQPNSNLTLNKPKVQNQNKKQNQAQECIDLQNKPNLKIRKMNIKMLPTN